MPDGHVCSRTCSLLQRISAVGMMDGDFGAVVLDEESRLGGLCKARTASFPTTVLAATFAATALAEASIAPAAAAPIATSGLNVNQTAVANVLNAAAPSATGTLAAQVQTLSALSPAAAQAGLDQLSGEIYADAPLQVRQLVDSTFQPIWGRLGLSEITPPPAAASTQAWGSLLGNRGHLDQDGNVDGLDYTAGGAMVGGDRSFGGWQLGLAAGGVHTRATGNQLSRGSYTGNIAQIAAYAGRAFSLLNAGAMLGYSQGPLDFSNTTPFGTGTQSLDAKILTAEARVAHTFALGQDNALTPILAVQTMHVNLASGQESSSNPLALSVHSKSVTSSDAQAMLRYDHLWGDGAQPWQFSLGGGALVYINNPDPTTVMNFAGLPNAPFVVTGTATHRVQATLAASLTAPLRPGMALQVGWQEFFVGYNEPSGGGKLGLYARQGTLYADLQMAM